MKRAGIGPFHRFSYRRSSQSRENEVWAVRVPKDFDPHKIAWLGPPQPQIFGLGANVVQRLRTCVALQPRMTSNYFTLSAICRELGPILTGARFEEAYSMRPNELRLRFDRGTLVAVLRPIDGALFFSDREERRPRQNVQLFFPELIGQELSGISIAAADRIVSLWFGEFELQLSLFGTPNGVFMKGEEVIGAYKKLREVEGPGTEKTKRTQAAERASGVTNLLGKQYLREVTARNTSPEVLVSLLQNSLEAFIHRTPTKILLSLVPLASLPDAVIEKRDSIMSAVRSVIIERGRFQKTNALRARLLSSVDGEIERLRHSLAEMRKGVENSNRAEKYAAIGNALLMSASEMQRGMEEITLEIEERPMLVKLNRDLSPYENASNYFDKAKGAKASKEELRQRTQATKSTLTQLEASRESILVAADLKDLEKIERVRSPRTDQSDPTETSDGKPKTHFREFTVPGNLTVLVGKNAKQNDELTTKIAKKEDIWLHARGVPGSHVVLQCGKRPQVPKEAIERAAEIAAYFSDAKSQPLAPVSYTRKKYVRKPKGADPGAVVMEREEVIMVRPQIPEKKA